MTPKPRRRKLDLFRVLLIVVGLGVSVSVGYQLTIHHTGMATAVRIALFGGG
jgi:hypothetical protein